MCDACAYPGLHLAGPLPLLSAKIAPIVGLSEVMTHVYVLNIFNIEEPYIEESILKNSIFSICIENIDSTSGLKNW
jgi:hypothetical protein